MQSTQALKALALASAITAALGLAAASAAAAKPGKSTVCNVGSPDYATIQSAVDDTRCASINLQATEYQENVEIGRDVEIRGAGPGLTTVRGIEGAVFRIPAVTRTPVVTLKGMTITGGSPKECFSGGGGIDSSGAILTVKDALIVGNESRTFYCNGPPMRPGQGGGINSFRTILEVKDSVIRDNVADRCGGIRVGTNDADDWPSQATISNSLIEDNDAEGSGIFNGNVDTPLGIGGGLCVTNPGGTLTLRDTTVTGNFANEDGGGIYMVYGTLVVKDSDVSDNVPNAIAP
jgi:predicted outer membrane repeat protein